MTQYWDCVDGGGRELQQNLSSGTTRLLTVYSNTDTSTQKGITTLVTMVAYNCRCLISSKGTGKNKILIRPSQGTVLQLYEQKKTITKEVKNPKISSLPWVLIGFSQ